MAIIRFDPYRTWENISKKMNDFTSQFEQGFNVEYGSFSPRVDIKEDEQNIIIEAELPGIKKEEVKITLNDENVLTIRGEKRREEKIEEKQEDKCYIRVERNFGSFTRSFMLPENINKESVQAKYDNGVLYLTLQKKEPEKPKEFNVEIV